MRISNHVFVALATCLGTALGSCIEVDIDFTDKTQVSCPLGQYMNGLIKGKESGNKDKIDDIVGLSCCTQAEGLSNASLVDYADWIDSFDENYHWNTCPKGYFAQGLQRGTIDKLEGIQAGRCAKPVDHPHSYGAWCYGLYLSNWVTNQEVKVTCSSGYYVVGFYRGGGNDLTDLDTLKCCKMLQPSTISIDEVKTLVMDKTRPGLADLAHLLGFGWCFGCRALNVGEHFDESESGWIASNDGDCVDGDRKKNRLKINYDDWRMATVDMTYGDMVVETLNPEETDSGVWSNPSSNSQQKELRETVNIVRSVSHTKPTEWENTTDFDVFFTNTMLSLGSYSYSYSFSYKDATKTKDITGREQVDTFTVSQNVTLPPQSAMKYSLNVNKTRYTVPYTARVASLFSVTLDGFLRGGMDEDPGENYHEDYFGDKSHPDFSHTFGDESTSFVDDLDEQISYNKQPWKWTFLRAAFPEFDTIVNSLLDESQYEFTVSGEFVQVVGTAAEFVVTEVADDEPVVGKRDLPSVTSQRVKGDENVIDLGEMTVTARDY